MKAKLVKELLEGRNVTVTNDAGEPMGTEYQYDSTDPEYHEQDEFMDNHDHYEFSFREFDQINWKLVHDILMSNTKIIKEGIDNDKLYDICELSEEGVASEDELYFLQDWNIIWMNEKTPMLDDDRYFDFEIFKTEVRDKWDKEPPYEPPERPEYITCQ